LYHFLGDVPLFTSHFQPVAKVQLRMVMEALMSKQPMRSVASLSQASEEVNQKHELKYGKVAGKTRSLRSTPSRT
jgi:hypothetical protein